MFIKNPLTLFSFFGYCAVFFGGSYVLSRTFAIILCGCMGGIVGYTFTGTLMGYERTTRHLRNRAGQPDLAFVESIKRWYCYIIGHRVAMKENGLQPLI